MEHTYLIQAAISEDPPSNNPESLCLTMAEEGTRAPHAYNLSAQLG